MSYNTAMLRHRLPLLITGVAGVAGFNAFHYLRRKYAGQVVAIRPVITTRLAGPDIVSQNAEDPVGMATLFDRYGFRSVLNCAGSCALKACEMDPSMARVANVVTADIIADLVRRHDARLVHLSSDLVFSGKDSPRPPGEALGVRAYAESDATDPVTVYGKTMVQGEGIIRSKVPKAGVLRISLPMGPSYNHHAGAIDWIQSRFRPGRPATLYFDEVRSSTYCDDLNDVFEKFLCNRSAGLFHCGGPVAMSLYQIAQVINRVGDYRPELLNGCPRIEAGPMPPRAGNVSMNSAKLGAELGEQPFQPWPSGDDLTPTDRQWHFERPIDEVRSVQQIAERLYRYPQKSLSAPA